MSNEVDRNKVFQTTRVRTALKNDGCWIQKSKQEQEQQDKRTDAAETRPAPVRQNSYVLFTAKKFEPQAPTEELQIQNGEAHPEGSVADAAAEIKEEVSAVYQSNVEHNGEAAGISAEVHVAECIQNGEDQPVSSTNENPEDVSPVEPAEKLAANATAENEGEDADTTVDQSSIDDNEAGVFPDAPAAETSAVVAEVPVAPAVEVKPQEEPSTETEPANAMHLEAAGVNITAEGSCEKCPPEQAAEEIVEAVAEVEVQSSPDTTDAVNAAPGEEAAPQDSVGPVAEVGVESSPETSAVTGAAGGEAALQVAVEPVPDLVVDIVSDSPTKPAAETAVKPVECEVVSEASVESVLKTGAEEAVESKVDDTVVEQSVEPTPERAAEPVTELNIDNAVKPVTASDALAVQEKFSFDPIDLSEALNGPLPTTEAASEPLDDPKRLHTEEAKLNQHTDDTNIADIIQKSKEELPSTQIQNENSNICSFCGTMIDGNVKIYLSEPVMTCHPECLKCGACAKPLGDMLTPMFLNAQVIQCDGCFAKALMI